MVFSTEGKRDQHIKFSPVHALPAEGPDAQPAEPTMDSITIYSGTKLFWRTRLNVELFMQQHKTANAVQVSTRWKLELRGVRRCSELESGQIVGVEEGREMMIHRAKTDTPRFTRFDRVVYNSAV